MSFPIIHLALIVYVPNYSEAYSSTGFSLKVSFEDTLLCHSCAPNSSYQINPPNPCTDVLEICLNRNYLNLVAKGGGNLFYCSEKGMFMHFHAGRSLAFLGASFGREYVPKQGRVPGCYSKLYACPLHCYWSSWCFYYFSSSVYVLDYLSLDPNT